MNLARLLLVDDEPQLVRALRPALQAEGYEVTVATTGSEAIAEMVQDGFDVVILDLGLPDMDGKAVIENVRRFSAVPIVVLSARGLEQERIEALDLGADDFVGKPFTVGELMARIRAALRGRRLRILDAPAGRTAALKLDRNTRSALVQGDEVRLTQREFEFVAALADAGGSIVSHRQLIATIWGPGARADNQTVRVLAAQVRQKLELDPARPEIILTATGLGYHLGC